MKLALQKLTVGIVLRVVHAALVELYALDTRVRDEFNRMPEGMSYALQTGYNAPQLFVQWKDGKLHNLKHLDKPVCALRLKSTGISFRMFTGQMGLAQAYAQHAFSMQGEIADVMNALEVTQFYPDLESIVAIRCEKMDRWVQRLRNKEGEA